MVSEHLLIVIHVLITDIHINLSLVYIIGGILVLVNSSFLANAKLHILNGLILAILL